MKIRRTLSLAAAAALLLAALWTPLAGATSVVPLDLDQIATQAQHIVHVRCTGQEVQPDAAVGAVTVTTFVVLDRAKGGFASTFTVRQPGGEREGLAIDYRVPKFEIGGEYVLFMPAASRWGLASPIGLSQGTFAVFQGHQGKEVGNGRDLTQLLSRGDRAAATGRLAARLAGPPAGRSRMDLDDFMSIVRAKAARR